MQSRVLDSRDPGAVALRRLLYAGFACFLFFPIYWMIATALRPIDEIFVPRPGLVTLRPTLENFARALRQSDLLVYLRNSLITAGGASLLTTALASLAAFGFAKYRFFARTPIMYLMISAQMFPFAVVLISLHSLLLSVELLNSLVGLLVSYVVFALPPAIYILHSFFARLPDELIEAARIDGASELDVLRRIVMPLSWPALIAVGVYSFMWAWNDLLYSLTLVTDEHLRTIGPGLLLTFFGEMQQDWSAAMAASILAALPAVVVFGTLQRYFVQGLTTGAIKS